MEKDKPQEILLPKLVFPKLKNVFIRQRVFDHFDLSKPATWVEGPAGSGKTTLVSSYLNSIDKTIIWYQIDAGDKDPASFFHHLSLAISQLTSRSKINLPVLTPEYMSGLEIFARNYFRAINQRLKTPYVLVLDNFQDMGDRNILHEILPYVVEEIPEGSHIIFISRIHPAATYSRLQINQQLNLIDWNILKFTYDEYQDYINHLNKYESYTSKLKQEQYEAIWKNTDGWITGIMLKLKSASINESMTITMDTDATQLLFNYFAAELFDKQAFTIREFLVKTAFLPVISAKMAQELTNEFAAEEILQEAYRQHFFTDCISIDNNIYQFHQLFREFLLMKAKSAWDDDRIIELYLNSAVILEKNHYKQEAITAFLRAKNWQEASRLICLNASSLLNNGFYKLVAEWIETFPSSFINKNPWLQYWYGISILTLDPSTARLKLESAYKQFKTQDDPDGTLMAWSSLTETYMFLRDNYKPLKTLINDLDVLYEKYNGFSNKKIKLSLLGSGLMVILFYEPEHHLLPVWADELKEVILEDIDLSTKVKLASFLMHYYSWKGDVYSMEIIFNNINPAIKKSNLTPLSNIIWAWAIALYSWPTNNIEIGKEAIHKGMSLALDKGIRIWDFALYTQATYLELFCGNKESIEDSLTDMLGHLRHENILDTGHYHYLAGWHWYKNKDYIKSEEHIDLAIAMTNKASTAYPKSLSEFAKSIIAIKNSDYETAKSLLEETYNFSISMNSKILLYKSLLGKAWLYLKKNNLEETISYLEQAFLIAKENKYYNFDWMAEDYISELVIIALKNEIETDYVCSLITTLNIQPDLKSVYINQWPWPVKIFTLGEFRVLVNDKEIETAKKGNKKPMELLKSIIALGVTNVSAETIQELLWPDADGDKAQQNFTVTLHRLRKLLNSNKAIHLANGKLSIDRTSVWLDVSGFLDSANIKTIINDEYADNIYNYLDLYNGEFLADESDSYWLLAMREKLRNRYLSLVETLGSYFLKNGNFEKAINIYNKGIDIEVCFEEFYQGLIKAYIAQNNKVEAALSYQRCSEVLDKFIGLKPSEYTQSLIDFNQH